MTQEQIQPPELVEREQLYLKPKEVSVDGAFRATRSGMFLPAKKITEDYVMVGGDAIIFADTTSVSANIILTLPKGINGKRITFLNVGTSGKPLSVRSQGDDTFDDIPSSSTIDYSTGSGAEAIYFKEQKNWFIVP